jgi:hypothetical protein
MTTILFSCNQEKKKVKNDDEMFVMEGFIEGVESDKVFIFNWEGHKDSTVITNGKFTLKTKWKEPCYARIYVEKDGFMTHIFAENVPFTLKGVKGKGDDCIVKGGKEHDYLVEYNKQKKVLSDKYQIKELYSKSYDKGISSEELAKINDKINEYYKEENKLQLKFVQENPKALYSLDLVNMLSSGASKEKIEKLLTFIDPKFKNMTNYKKVQETLAKLGKGKDASLDVFMKEAKNVEYQLDKNFKGNSYTNIAYMCVLSNNNICTLKKDGTIQILSPNGKKLNEFKVDAKGHCQTISADAKDNLYVTDVQQKDWQSKIRGRIIKRTQPNGVNVMVYDVNGKHLRNFKAADMISSTGAKVSGNKLVLADTREAFLGIYDAQSGKLLSKMENMRPCCNILDIDINEKNEIIVADLGAFRVRSFDMEGNTILSFGNRGRELMDFHGCCNPVSVASLSTGAIVTVEKDPTRVKVFSKDGAKAISGIEELVQGCLHIPMAVDGNDNLYLASQKKGIVKCVVN